MYLAQHNREGKSKTIKTDITAYIEPYQQHFLKDPKSFVPKSKSSNEEKRLLELVRYVFCKYRVGLPLTRVWLRKLPKPSQVGWRVRERQPKFHTTIPDDPVDWFICVAQGGSLYKSYSKRYLTKMETHLFLNCPHDLSFEQILVWAAAKTFASNDGLALRLAHSKLNTLHFNPFLKTIIYFFAKNPPNSLEEINDLVDFIMYRQESNTWTLAGRTLDSLRQKCKDWHFELRRIKVMGIHEWEGAPIPDSVIKTGSEQQPMVWRFTQIKTSKILAAEGTAMRHCVYGYRDSCIRGYTSIWSLCLDEHGNLSRKVTIELNNDGRIVQARGLANRLMRPEERHVVGLWARANGLDLRC